jgi:hypothetical protein
MARARATVRRKTTVQKKDAFATPRRGETVPFEMVCKPRSGAGMQQLMTELAPDAVEPFARVAERVRALTARAVQRMDRCRRDAWWRRYSCDRRRAGRSGS